MNVTIFPDAEQGRWPRISLGGNGEPMQGDLEVIGLLRHGTMEGRATVSMAIRLRDGRVIFAETSWRLLQVAVAAMAAGPVGSEEVLDS